MVANTHTRALALKTKAGKAITKGVLFGNRYKTAVRYLKSAVQLFRKLENWKEVAECLVLQADCCVQLKRIQAAFSLYKEAVLCYHQVSEKDVCRVSNKLSRMYCEHGDFLAAAQLERDCGDLLFQNEEYSEAATHYRNASGYFSANKNENSSVNCLEAEAGCYIKLKNYGKAGEIFDEIVNCNPMLLKWKQKEYVLCSLLCQFIEIRKEDHSAALMKLQKDAETKFQALNESFETTREFKVLKVFISSGFFVLTFC